MIFEQVCVIGLGLIGASLAQAIRDRGLAQRIVAVDRHASSITAAINEGVIDAGSNNLAEVVENSDCIIIAVPVKAVDDVFDDIYLAMQHNKIERSCIISDVCSTKQNVVDAAKKAFNTTQIPSGFVPAHPIAGAEKSGFNARRAELFVNHSVIVCQLDTSDSDAIDKIKLLWQSVGATVMIMDVVHHDKVLAYTSHLPHLLAFNLVDQLACHNDNMDIFRYAAGGFRDFTRIAASDPTMWHDIFIANKAALLDALDEYSLYLGNLRKLIENEDSSKLIGLLGRAQSARQHFGHMLTSTPYTNKITAASLTDNDSSDANKTTNTYIITPCQTVHGTIEVPGDKSISHRSIIFGSLANGITTVTGFLEGEDSLATLQAFRDMGVTIEGPDNGKVVIHGVGLNGLKPSHTPIYMGNSGTSMRLIAGILAAQRFNSVMTGDKSLSKRPMERIAVPLREMGASLQTTGSEGTAPISFTGSDKRGTSLHGISYKMPVASAQVKSCLLLAGLWAEGKTTITQPAITRDHTERMLQAFGYDIQIEGNRISLECGGELHGCDITVPADISSAAFFMVAASIAKESQITIKQVGINPTRTGVIEILRLMGANINVTNHGYVGREPVADITVKSAPLQGVIIPEYLVPLAIDEFPVLFVAASCAYGRTILTGAKELRVKESDRISVMAEGLKKLGIDCVVKEDGIVIEGKGQENTHNTVFTGGKIDAQNDHRIAMSFAIASIRAKHTITIEGVEAVNTSFPGFANLANTIGLNVATR